VSSLPLSNAAAFRTPTGRKVPAFLTDPDKVFRGCPGPVLL
jgi:hypothetical protein